MGQRAMNTIESFLYWKCIVEVEFDVVATDPAWNIQTTSNSK